MKNVTSIIIVGFLFLSIFNIIHATEICSATGTTIYVDDSGGKDYTKIQDAINAANPGDTIYVYEGIYNENISISKNIILTGVNKDTVIVDGGEKGRTVYANGSAGSEIEVQISGFTIENAGGTGNSCIALSYVNNGIINDNKIMNSADSDGIKLSHCNGVTINGNIISNNKQYGINLISSSSNTIGTLNQIQNNQMGIYLYLSSNNNIINNNTITGNTQYGVYVFQSSGNCFYKNDFSNNGQNAQDAFSNSWSYNGQGNYWDDYTGKDENHDGIGDTPYDIPPGGINQDLYPLGYFGGEEPHENQKPVAYIDAVPSVSTYGQSVSFSGHGTDSDGTVVGYNWISDIDGQLSTSASFSTTHLSLGTHTIYFKVIDDDGAWSDEKSTQLTITISQNQKPTAYILEPTQSTATFGETVEFLGHGTDTDGSIVGYSWRSSGPTTISSEESSFSMSNLLVGTYTIYFKVEDNNGDWSSEVSRTLTILSNTPQNDPPVANASGPYHGYVNQSITFDGSNSYDPNTEDVLSYNWNFGDGSTGVGISPQHTYTSEGNYSVELTVVDEHGMQSKNTTYVNVTLSENGAQEENKGTPGFETILVIIAISFAVIWKRYLDNKKREN